MKENQKLKTEAAKGEPVNSKLLLTLTQLTLKIRQDIKAKKILILNIS